MFKDLRPHSRPKTTAKRPHANLPTLINNNLLSLKVPDWKIVTVDIP